MAYEKATNTWRAGIAVCDVQVEACWAFGAALSCLVEGLRLMQTAVEVGQKNQLSGDDNCWPVESTPTVCVDERLDPVQMY